MIRRRLLGLLGLLLLLGGCASINERHPELAAAAGPDVATVYFIRPVPTFTHPYADAPVSIQYQGELLLTLDEGVYTLVYLKPGNGEVRIYNNTLYTNNRQSQRVWRERRYRFVAGRTYFIHVKQVDEEFRGIFYEPELVDLKEAKFLIRTARAYGGAALAHPINKLKETTAPPAGAVEPLEPALPEQLNPRGEYMKPRKP